jgi:hypothetical protein
VPSTDRVTVTADVAVDPATAFEVFTSEIGAWWTAMRPGSGPHTDRAGVLRFEPGAGGRLLEVFDGEARDPFVIGLIRIWEFPSRLVFEWRQGNFAAHESTEVEVRFEAAAGGTRVTLEHRGFDALPPDHGTRHGLGVGPAFARMMRDFWSERLAEAGARARRGRGA